MTVDWEGVSAVEGDSPVLDTKLGAPRLRPSVVRRSRLTARLDEGARGRLVLVSAPAGFGKTTVLCEWMATDPGGADVDVAWLSLDAADSDLMRFLTYLVAAVGTVMPHVGEELAAGLRSPRPPVVEVVLTDLVNAVARSPRDVVVVLDDFHAVDSTQVDLAVVFLVERAPPQLHLVIAGREDPRLPLARWRRGRDERAARRRPAVHSSRDGPVHVHGSSCPGKRSTGVREPGPGSPRRGHCRTS